MINMLRNHRVIGHVVAPPKLKERKKVYTKIFLRVREIRKFKNDDGSFSFKPYYTTIPFYAYGKTAEYAEEYIVRGQKVLIEFSIDSLKASNDIPSRIVLVATAVQTLERAETAEERMKKFDEANDKKENEEEDKRFDNIDLQYISDDEEEFPF